MSRIALLILIAMSAVASPQESMPPFRVIVNASNPVSTVDRKFLSDAFLKKVTRWSNESVIQPVDLDPGSAVRRKFSEVVFRRPVHVIKNYWQQNIFSGHDVPPPELGTETLVVEYVRKHPNAIGYVSDEAVIEGVKVLTVQ